MACFWRALFVLEPFPLGHLQGGVEISFRWLSGSWLSFGSLRVPRASPGGQGTHTDPHREAKGPASTPAPPAGTACPQQALEPRCLLTPRPSEPEGRAGACQQNADDQLLLRGSSQASRRAHADGSGSFWAFPLHSRFPKHLTPPLLTCPPCSTALAQPTTATAPLATPLTHGTAQAVATAPRLQHLPALPVTRLSPECSLQALPPLLSIVRGSSPHHHAALGQNNHTKLHKNLPPRSQAPQH